MNERVLTILRRIARTSLTGKAPGREEVRQSLLGEGFTPREIDAAFRWLDRSEEPARPGTPPAPDRARGDGGTAPPGATLGPDAMAFLQMLRDLGYLDDRIEDEVLNRITAHAEGEVTLPLLRRMVAEVVFERQFELDSELLTLLDDEWKMVFH